MLDCHAQGSWFKSTLKNHFFNQFLIEIGQLKLEIRLINLINVKKVFNNDYKLNLTSISAWEKRYILRLGAIRKRDGHLDV